MRPRRRPAQLPVPKHHRDGEQAIAHSFLGRSVQLWYQQCRRLNSLLHSLRSAKASACADLTRSQTWKSIRNAKGFRDGFPHWWKHRPHRTQGAPMMLPVFVPSLADLELIVNDFSLNYQKYETWNLAQRRRSLVAKTEEHHERCFQVVGKEPRGQLEFLVDEQEQPIQVIDGGKGIVQVQHVFPPDGVVGWILEGEPVCVKPLEGSYQIECDRLLLDGQVLKCSTIVPEIAELQSRFASLWTARWSKHKDVPEAQWNRIVSFCEHYLPKGCFQPPPITYEIWLTALKAFKLRSAKGPDGWSRLDLLSLPKEWVEHILKLFACIEAGGEWPAQLQKALIHVLEKRASATQANDYRPITLMSILYRLWAGIRARQLLHHLTPFLDAHQCGFAEAREAADLWYLIQAEIEVHVVTGKRMCGIVGDLVKAYNYLAGIVDFGGSTWFTVLLAALFGWAGAILRYSSVLRRRPF